MDCGIRRMKNQALISVPLLLYAAVITASRGTDLRDDYIHYDNGDPIIAQAGSSAVISCTFNHHAAFKPTSVILMTCESKPVCGKDDVIFDSEDADAAEGPFNGLVSLLEPDLRKKNCTVRIDGLKKTMSALYQIGVNGQSNRPHFIRTKRKKLILVTATEFQHMGMTAIIVVGVLVAVVALTAMFHCIFRCRKSRRDQAEVTETLQDQQTGGQGDAVDGREQTLQDEPVYDLPWPDLGISIHPPSTQGELALPHLPPPSFRPPPPPLSSPQSAMRPPSRQGQLPPPPPSPPSSTSSSSTPPPDFTPPPPPRPSPNCPSPPDVHRLHAPLLDQNPASVKSGRSVTFAASSSSSKRRSSFPTSPPRHGVNPVLPQSPAEEADLPLVQQRPSSGKHGRRVTFAAASSSSRRRVSFIPPSTTDKDEPCQSAYF